MNGRLFSRKYEIFFYLLEFQPITLPDEIYGTERISYRQQMINRLIIDIKRAMGVLTYKEMSEEERNLGQIIINGFLSGQRPWKLSPIPENSLEKHPLSII